MKILFMGTPSFAVPCLEMLQQNNYEVIGVFTQPDRPKGRGKKIIFSPVKHKALDYGLKTYQPKTLKNQETTDLIKKMNIDMIIAVAYGQILPKEILDIPPLKCVNVHASLLPKYRGAGPINWSIINGDKNTGITTMYMDIGLDEGDMLIKEQIEIGKDETAQELHDRLAELGAIVLKDTLEKIKSKQIKPIKQNHSEATYAPMLKKELGNINWGKSAEEIKNLIRGTVPWPSAYTNYLGQTMKILQARIEPYYGETNILGKIVDVKKDGIYVQTAKDILVIEVLQFSGKKPLEVKDYLIGNNIEKNIVLGENDGI